MRAFAILSGKSSPTWIWSIWLLLRLTRKADKTLSRCLTFENCTRLGLGDDLLGIRNALSIV